ncbi:ABC transporter ATP-binding protein [Sporomusa acidovorans]|uniref:Nickel import system ATP-binding protein NikD n=1 Tax=Sporomusa acidovorans (strain ATCC 49682 / DSM 3132 / Mol) TaxID=1123286 RepID=A0ABZ3IYJ4_SPOA4|nr:ABC transporter ATP-binding protein [Sporomusa acidovorans]OZC22187.1 oligopeptide transport ATP-binding protein OppD [Sporomusa acidovorans DSM 3132]SDE81942.1 peptide/nickel transport system ATP-binding protein [Sporomusa acidovorans]
MLLNIDRLRVTFTVGPSRLQAVNEVHLALAEKTKAAVIGETGCGKSVLAAAIVGILPANAHAQGKITWEDQPLSGRLLKSIRGKELSLIPQNPAGSLNPVFTAGFQVREALQKVKPRLHKNDLYHATLELFHAAGFARPETVYHAYPHQLSGGMAQRVLLAIATAGTPRLVIADEPTKGLDLDTRNQNVLLMHRILESSALLIITHDIEVAATCQAVIVMYAGEIVETGQAETILSKPRHPYTRQLLAAHPSQGLIPIPGLPPMMTELPAGCRFAERCALYTNLSASQQQLCLTEHPSLQQCGSYSVVRCWHA